MQLSTCIYASLCNAHTVCWVLNSAGPVVKVLELVGTTTLEDSLLCANQHGIVCMTGMVGNKWALDNFSPMGSIPTTVCLTTYAGKPLTHSHPCPLVQTKCQQPACHLTMQLLPLSPMS